MLKIQASLEYALQMLHYMGQRERELVQANKMAQDMKASYLYMMKILAKMREAKLVEFVQGRHGGYRLTKPIREVSVLEVYCAVEGEFILRQSEDEAIGIYFAGIETWITDTMKKTKLVVSEQGCYGGYRLGKRVEDISIYDIVCAI